MLRSTRMNSIDRELLLRIPSEPPGASTTELRAALASAGYPLTARAVQKRLASLEARHDLRCERGGKPHRWSIDKRSKQKLLDPMTPAEALSLSLAHQYLRPLLPPASQAFLRERLDEIDESIRREHGERTKRWKDKVRRVPNELARRGPQVARGVFDSVSRALYEGLVIETRYRKRYSRTDALYRLHPLALLERSDALWLVARTEDEGELAGVKQFVLHRMRSVEVQRGSPVKSPPGFSIDKWIESGHAHFVLGPPIELVARFHADVAERLEESPIGEGQTLARIDDEWFRCRTTVSHTRALVAFLTSYGPLCVVEKPKALREAIRTDLQRALDAYRAT